jgi:hypothetical protein
VGQKRQFRGNGVAAPLLTVVYLVDYEHCDEERDAYLGRRPD